MPCFFLECNFSVKPSGIKRCIAKRFQQERDVEVVDGNLCMQKLKWKHGRGLVVRVRVVGEYDRGFHGNIVVVVRDQGLVDNDRVAVFPYLGVTVDNERIYVCIDVKFRFADSGVEVVEYGT